MILVTGATGFIGSHLVRAFVERGKEVRCLIRKGSNLERLKGLEVELYYGDLLDRDSLRNAAKGSEVVYHLAGVVYSLHPGDYYRVNVLGTENLIDASISEGVKRFIYFSSIQAVGPNKREGVLLDENTPCRPITPYGRSKLEAERIVLRFMKEGSLPSVIVRLPLVYGPGASNCRSAILFRMIYKGIFKFIGKSESRLISTCYIENLLKALSLMEESERASGNIYFIADGEPYPLGYISSIIAKELGVKRPQGRIPLWLAYIFAVFLFLPNKMLGFFPPLSFYTIRELIHHWACSFTLAEKDLGYKPEISLEEGLKRTAKWYKESVFKN